MSDSMPPLELFESKIMPVPEAGCWIWTGAESTGGYGQIMTKDRRPKTCSRLSWQFYVGPIPKGMCVCHKCDTPLCVNPDHLFLGTQLDNVRDMIRKGRMPPTTPQIGTKNPGNKISEETVLSIFRSGDTYLNIANAHGVSHSLVQKIKDGYLWSSVTGLPKRPKRSRKAADQLDAGPTLPPAA